MKECQPMQTTQDAPAIRDLPYSLLLELSISDPEIVSELCTRQEGRERDEYAISSQEETQTLRSSPPQTRHHNATAQSQKLPHLKSLPALGGTAWQPVLRREEAVQEKSSFAAPTGYQAEQPPFRRPREGASSILGTPAVPMCQRGGNAFRLTDGPARIGRRRSRN